MRGFVGFFLACLFLLSVANCAPKESLSDGSYRILPQVPGEATFVITQGDISDSRVLKVNTDLKDSKGRSFWDKVFVYNPKNCQKLLELSPNYSQEMEYPEYFLYYKPTLLRGIQGADNKEATELDRVIDVKLKNDVFTIVLATLFEDLSDLKGDLQQSQRLRIWYGDYDDEKHPSYSGWIERLKFLDDNTATYAVDANGKYADAYKSLEYFNSKTTPNLHICPYSAKTLLETLQKRHPEWKSD